MTEIAALPLIFTNVEAEDSPTRQRGFQVWQEAAGLTPEARKEITRRVDDFKLPPGTAADDALNVTRDAFFGLSEKAGGGFAVARTVPLPDKDKFGRGGRFFAHVFVVSAADFAAISCDPFALFDAATFWARPAQVKGLNADWRAGRLPPVTLHLAGPAAPDAPAPGPLAALAGHVDRDATQRRTVVLVGKPAEVAGRLRAVYRGLPPKLRAACEFDTLSGGASLTQVPCAFAGCPSPESLKLWAFRRFVRLDDSGTLTPPADPPRLALATQLLAAEAWAGTPDATRDAAWKAAHALSEGDLAAAAAHLGRDGSVQPLLESCPALAPGLDGLRASWRGKLPPAVAAVPGVAEQLNGSLAAPLPDLLRTLQADPPRGPVESVVLDQVAMQAHRGDGDADLRQIQTWCRDAPEKSSDGRRLDWVLSRLLYADLDDLLAALGRAADGDDEEWFRDWVRDYLEATGVTADSLAGRLPHDAEDGAISPTLFDAALYLRCSPRGDAYDTLVDLNFRYQFRTGGAAAVIGQGEDIDIGLCAKLFESRVTLGWTPLSAFSTFAGVFVYPRLGRECDLIEHLAGADADARGLLTALFPQTRRRRPPLIPALSADGPLAAFLDELKRGKVKPVDVGAELLARFEGHGDEFFKEVAAFLKDKLLIEHYPEAAAVGRAALFGFRLSWKAGPQPPPLDTLLRLALAAGGPEPDRAAFPPPPRRSAPAKLAELLSFLL